VAITNEYNTSQNCIFCFKKLLHPLAPSKTNPSAITSIRGTFNCVNPSCPSVIVGKSHHGRDCVSAASIAFSGLSTVLFGIAPQKF
ncbi:hypothetical protein EDC94DRAFT_492742, partial [Helicostylum pulchrum]